MIHIPYPAFNHLLLFSSIYLKEFYSKMRHIDWWNESIIKDFRTFQLNVTTGITIKLKDSLWMYTQWMYILECNPPFLITIDL